MLPAVLVALLGLLTVPTFAASTPSTSAPSATPSLGQSAAPVGEASAIVGEIEQLLTTAPVVQEGARREKFVTIVVDASGRRYAVIDFKHRPESVTTNIPLVEWQTRFGLDSVRVVFPPEQPVKPAEKKGDGAEPSVACEGYPDCLVWFNPDWSVSHFRDELDRLDQFRAAGTRVFCRNMSPWPASCTSQITWSTTAGLNTKVTIDELWEIGLNVAQTYSISLSQTSPNVPSGWRVYFQPDVNYDMRFWTEARRRLWCGTYVGLPWCVGPTRSRWESNAADGEIFIARGLTMWGVPN
jgi:hypothetical protein